MKAARALMILFLTALPALGWAAGELAPHDGNRTKANLLTKSDGTTDVWESDDAGAAKVSLSGLGTITANQGTSGADADPWNMMIRNASGTELGLAASPFGVQLFDAAAAAIGVPANPWIVGGPAADGAAVSGNPVRIATTDNSGNTQNLISGSDGILSAGRRIAGADGASNALVAPVDEQNGATQFRVAPFVFNGTTWDRVRGDATDGALVNLGLNNDVTIAVGQTASEPVVISIGTTPTQIFAASTTRRLGFVQNAGTSSVFLGKAAVTTSTGEILAGSNVANDGKGASAKAEHGDAIFGIVASGTVNVRVSEVSD